MKKNKKRDIDKVAKNVYGWWNNDITLIKKSKIRLWQATLIVVFILGSFVGTFLLVKTNRRTNSMAMEPATMISLPTSSSISSEDLLLDVKNKNIDLYNQLMSDFSGSPELKLLTTDLFNIYRKFLLSAKTLKEDTGMIVNEKPYSKLGYPGFTTEFDITFKDIFSATLTNEWIGSCNDCSPWNSGMMGDEIAMAPPILYALGRDTNNSSFISKADMTVEHEINAIDGIISKYKAIDWNNPDQVAVDAFVQEMMDISIGSPGLIAGIDNYSGTTINKAKIELYVRAGSLAGGLGMLFFNSLIPKGEEEIGPVVFMGAAADVNISLYEKTKKISNLLMGKWLLDALENNYKISDSYGTYYAASPGPWDFEISNYLLPLSKYYRLTNSSTHKQRMESSYNAMKNALFDNESGIFFASSDGRTLRGIGLSNELFDISTLLSLYQATGDTSYLSTAQKTLVYISKSIGEGGLWDNNGHLIHDRSDNKISTFYCVGCQFFYMKEVYDFEKLKKEACTVNLNINPTAVAYNGSSNLTWSSSKTYGFCKLNGGMYNGIYDKLANNLAGISTGNLVSSTGFTMTCRNLAGVECNNSKTVNVTQPSCTVSSFYGSPSSVSYKTSSKLYWGTSGDVSGGCKISGGIFDAVFNKTSGVSTGNLTANTGYTLTCKTESGATCTKSTTVSVKPNPACTISMNANPSIVTPGKSSVLSWTTTNVVGGCKLDGGRFAGFFNAISGVSTWALYNSTSYILTCKNSSGLECSKSVAVTVAR